MTCNLSTPRRCSQVQDLRHQTAYVNFPSPLTRTHDSEASVPSSIFQRKAWTKIEEGFGSRHLEDTAPFSLWDQERKEFRGPTDIEKSWIFSRYQATAIHLDWPIVIIETEYPPSPLPVTVGCVAALFVPPPNPFMGEKASSSRYLSSQYLPSSFEVNTSFASPRVLDPISTYKLESWKIPTRKQQEHVLEVLNPMMNIKRLNFVWPYIIVELYMDDRVYATHSLPGRIAGCTTLYHRSELTYWQDMKPRTREILIDPKLGIQDTTNYLEESSQSLTPGVRVSSAPLTNQGYAIISRSTTAGVVLRNHEGQVRLTVANHGFLESEEVFHPTTNDFRIGEISERWPAQDVALVKLDPSISFRNLHYFEAQTPLRLLRSEELERSKTGKWFSVDGMSTGLLFLFLRGVSLYQARRPSPNPIQIDFCKWTTEHVFRLIGPAGGSTKDGICGAAIVEDDPEMGGVAGFFQLANDEICLSPVLDEFIDRGWTLL